MNSTKCMQCGLVNWQTEAECKRCKAPIAQAVEAYQYQQPYYQQPQYQQQPPVYPYAPPPPPQDFSQPQDYPYMPPMQMQAGLWRDGSLLVMSKQAALPPACVKCNQSVGQADFKKKLYWHHPALYLLLLPSWLVYVVVALCVRKTATVYLGLCDNHRTQRRYIIAVCWLLALLGMAGIAGAMKMGDSMPVMLGALSILASLVVYCAAVPVVAVQKMDDHYIWLKKINPNLLAQLPSLPR